MVGTGQMNLFIGMSSNFGQAGATFSFAGAQGVGGAALAGGALGGGGALTGWALTWETAAGGGGRIDMNGNNTTPEQKVDLAIAEATSGLNNNGGIEGIDFITSPSGAHYSIEPYTGPTVITGMAPTPGFAKGSKFALQLAKQLERDGAKSILKSYSTIQRRLFEHKAKLPGLQYKSSVEREIRTFKTQIETLKEFMKSHGIKY